MKKIALLFIAVLLFSGCAEDGDDGKASLKFWWTGTLYDYTDNNPDIPYTIWSDTYYPVSKGTYYFYYTSWNSSTWNGSYTITIDEGDDAVQFPIFIPIDGDDGDDSYFELMLLSTGPSFFDWGSTAYKVGDDSSVSSKLSPEEQDEYSQATDEVLEMRKGDPDTIPYFDPDGEDVIVKELRQGIYKVVLKYTVN